MASPYLINSSNFTLTTGDYQFVWGSLDPQQLSTQKVVIACDTTSGDVNIILPQSGSPQSNNVIFFICKVSADSNAINISPADGDLLSGAGSSFPISTHYQTVNLINYFSNNWASDGLF